MKKQLSDLSNKIDHTLQPVFKSRKICEDLKMCEPKPPIISQQCVVYNSKCDLCDADIYTTVLTNTVTIFSRLNAPGVYLKFSSFDPAFIRSRRLIGVRRLMEKMRYSAIGKHLKNDHGLETIGDLTNNFSVLKKCNGKLDCLIYEMLFIKKKRPYLNTQSDSIRAKLFI